MGNTHSDNINKLARANSLAEHLDGLAEECAEFIQAVNKKRKDP